MAHQERGTKRPRTAVGSSAAAAVEIDDMASSNFQSTLGVASIPNHKDSAATASWNSQVKFDLEIVENLIFCHEWEKLEYYLFKFLSNAHGKIVRSHPGLFCSVYEACISDLIKKRKVKEEVHIFKDKVEPLSYDGDSLYRPIDLEVRVERLKQIIKNSILPPDFVEEDNKMVVVNYIQLYFPESLSQTNLIIFPKGSVKCFLRHFMTQKGVEELDMKEIVPAYVTDSSKSLQTPESSSSSNSSFLSTASPSKKMAPFRYDAVSVPQSSVFVDPSSGLDILNKIQSGNISLVTSVSRWTTPIGIKVKELCLSQVKPITVLIDIFLDAISKGALMDGYMVLKKADALRFTPRDFYPLLQYAPDRVFELVLEQDRLIYDLRYTCLAVAAAAAVTTGTPGNSTSITPPADELHVEGKVASGAEGMM
ncbi:hypothetical protein PVAP13_4KG372900 [Panicum virgatum]|uniref:Uncharacterized protein n=1 Tax=Panicum virgatum TaxID=38727 RepID=A0A8T0TQC3_PANVG|nr:hypothetical protein PVAP13_4KG372900 [Panicum virgatum]